MRSRSEICVRRQSNRIGIRPSWGAPGGHRRWLPLARERKRHYSAIWRWPHRGMHARVMGSNFEGPGLQATDPRAKWWHSFFEERWLADTLSVDWAAKDRAEKCSELVRVLTFARSQCGEMGASLESALGVRIILFLWQGNVREIELVYNWRKLGIVFFNFM